MEEKYMVNDILESSKESLKTYQGVIIEAANTNLRQALQEIRNSGESFQYDLFRVAQMKGYYKALSGDIRLWKVEYENKREIYDYNNLGQIVNINLYEGSNG